MVTINIGRKEAIFFGVVIFVAVVASLAISYGSGDPTDHGHDSGEIDGITGGGGSGETYLYTAVMGLTNAAYCPVGWELNNFADIRRSDGYLNIVQTENLFIMGSMPPVETWREYIRTEIHTNNNVPYICSKSFSNDKKPYVVVFMSSMTSDKCPSGFTYVPANILKRNDGWGYFHSVEGGFYMGGLNNWWRDSQTVGDSGWQGRQWHSYGQGICYDIINDEGEGSSGAVGTYPVIMTMQDATACPADYESGSITDFAGTDGYMHIAFNDNSATFGAVQTWWDANGENALRVRAHRNWVSTLCWKFYETTSRPKVNYRVLPSGSCPAGYTSIPSSKLIGPNNNHGHIMVTPEGTYMGALDWWDTHHSYNDGDSRYWFDSSRASTICYKVENVI